MDYITCNPNIYTKIQPKTLWDLHIIQLNLKRQREACKTKVDIGGESLKLQQSTYPMHTDKK